MTKPDDLAKALQTKAAAAPDSTSRAKAAVAEFTKAHQLNADDEKRLVQLIDAAIDERLNDVVDIRIGRVLGSALAHL